MPNDSGLIDMAVQCYLRRKRGEEKPSGDWQITEKTQFGETYRPQILRFVIASQERQECCPPHRTVKTTEHDEFCRCGEQQHPEYLHCNTMTHIANLYGVSRLELVRAIHATLKMSEETNNNERQ